MKLAEYHLALIDIMTGKAGPAFGTPGWRYAHFYRPRMPVARWPDSQESTAG
jgi:hypothetical protein